MALSLRGDLRVSRWRGLVKNTKDGPQVRRLLALAAIYVGDDAAKIRRCRASDQLGVGVALQGSQARRAAEWQRDAAARHAQRQPAPVDRSDVKTGPIPMIHGVVRWWLAVRIQPYYDPTMVIVTAAH